MTYTQTAPSSAVRTPEGKPIDAAKELVPITELAERLCPEGLRRVGRNLIARCPLPGHEDKTPSFYVYTETESCWCFGCQRGGDVVDLAALAWGYTEHEMVMAAANLLQEFGHEIPQQTPAWFVRQSRQKPIRDALDEAFIVRWQSRFFRWFIEPGITPDPDEKLAEIRQGWNDAGRLARLMYEQRRAR